jgi:hypothetical protein
MIQTLIHLRITILEKTIFLYHSIGIRRRFDILVYKSKVQKQINSKRKIKKRRKAKMILSKKIIRKRILSLQAENFLLSFTHTKQVLSIRINLSLKLQLWIFLL